MILFLDDDAERIQQFKQAIPSAIIIVNAQDCISYLADPETECDILFLDHDLGGEIWVDKVTSE